MTYTQLRDLEKQLDKARIAVIINLNAYDDDLGDSYNNAKTELKKVIELIKELEPIDNKIESLDYELKFVYSQIRKHDRTGILKEMFKDKL